MYFFGFLPQTNESMKKTLKKLLFRQNFLLYSNCIYYTSKRGFCLNGVNTPKNVENTSFIILFQKKYIVAIFSVFCLLFDENNEISRKSSKK